MAAIPYSGVGAGDADASPAVASTPGVGLRPVIAGVCATIGVFLPAPAPFTGNSGAGAATIVRVTPSATIGRL
jgi:hypothetical protein